MSGHVKVEMYTTDGEDFPHTIYVSVNGRSRSYMPYEAAMKLVTEAREQEARDVKFVAPF